MKQLTVTAAILINNNQILCMQRDKAKYDYISYKFEFPGGKLEEGETNEKCLSRELAEEMGIEIEIKDTNYFMTIEHNYPDFSIKMHSYIIVVPSRNFIMKEHIDAKWLNANELESLDWAEADKPIVKELKRKFK